MVLDLDVTFAKLTNPRMSAGLLVLHSLLSGLQGEPVEPREVRKSVDAFMSKRNVSKQSITNAARRLEEANIIGRKENKYAVNYGYLVSVLLNTILEMNERITNLEEEVESIKSNN
ncbi:hypothetical protein EU527_00665 [Candidatus Thorarchaeota archaeon]|nr:MAG: hypothetical protein EU527_00665 [Candidatus Thorarchaeota archaeon]